MMYISGLKNIFKTMIFVFFLFISSYSFSQINVSGYASSYAGDILKIYKYSDYIVNKTELIDTAKVAPNGYFNFSFELENTQKIYIELFHVNTYLYVEPGKSYRVRIPTKQVLTDFQLGDPYFEKEFASAFVVSNNKYELNRLIHVYSGFISQNVNILLKKTNKSEILAEIDTLKTISDTFAQVANNEYFNNYKEYSMATMRYVTLKDNKQFYIDSFFLNKPVLYFLSPYMDLFKYIFENFFSGSNSFINITNIYAGMRANNFIQIKNALVKDSIGINEDLAQLITVKALYDKFFLVDRAENDIIFSLQSVLENEVNNYIYIASQNALAEITRIRKSFPAYNFDLPNKRGRNKQLDNFSRKFIYLSFIYPSSGRGLKHLPMLQSYHDDNIKGLKIVTIFVGDSLNEMINFLDDNDNYNWTFLFAKPDNLIISNYAVQYYPSYFLIDPEGNLCLDYTPTPEEEFEQTYNTVFKEWQNKPRNNSGIR